MYKQNIQCKQKRKSSKKHYLWVGINFKPHLLVAINLLRKMRIIILPKSVCKSAGLFFKIVCYVKQTNKYKNIPTYIFIVIRPIIV